MSARVVVVTGTDTGVGKTVMAAALAVRASGRGTVTVIKPVQTGVGPQSPDESSDADEVRRLAGGDVRELVRVPDALAPDTAARLRDLALPAVAEHAAAVRALAHHGRTVVVEGAGGLLVRLDREGGTLLDLAVELADLPLEVVVVTRAGLGTLNHTELTVAALRARGIEPAGLALGSWPIRPGLAETCNRRDLPAVTGLPLLAVVPAGAGSLSREEFRTRSGSWFLDPAATGPASPARPGAPCCG